MCVFGGGGDVGVQFGTCVIVQNSRVGVVKCWMSFKHTVTQRKGDIEKRERGRDTDRQREREALAIRLAIEGGLYCCCSSLSKWPSENERII